MTSDWGNYGTVVIYRHPTSTQAKSPRDILLNLPLINLTKRIESIGYTVTTEITEFLYNISCARLGIQDDVRDLWWSMVFPMMRGGCIIRKYAEIYGTCTSRG